MKWSVLTLAKAENPLHTAGLQPKDKLGKSEKVLLNNALRHAHKMNLICIKNIFSTAILEI